MSMKNLNKINKIANKFKIKFIPFDRGVKFI